MAITTEIVDLVTRRTPGRRVARVRLRVGELSGVVVDAVRFCFEVATAGTSLEGAELDVVDVLGLLVCRTCGTESRCPDRILLCPCGSADVSVIAGEELTVAGVELWKETSCAAPVAAASATPR